jgi:uncharacterized repeat protein (TIGR03843 family)
MAIDANTLTEASLEVVGRLVDASNATLLCKLDGSENQVIYKPILGERPLWDFPDGNLASREVAAFYLSDISGFNLVPLTIMRDGPYGPGSVQEWIEVPEEFDAVTFGQSKDQRLSDLALFDAVVNNTDRKYGHLLMSAQGNLYGCDHGVTLHSENKLRTVLWQFAGLPLTALQFEYLQRLNSSIDQSYLGELITDVEIQALYARINSLLEVGALPYPSQDWPAVPWPPF